MGTTLFRRIPLDQLLSRHGPGMKDLLRSAKIIHVVDASPEFELKRIYADIADSIGRRIPMDEEPLAEIGGESSLWLDVRYDEKLQQSFRYSSTSQPLHTDSAYKQIPVDVGFLYCEKQAQTGGETIFLDSRELVDQLSKIDPSLFNILRETPFFFQKANSAKSSSVIGYDQEGPLLNWNYYRTFATLPSHQSAISAFQSFLAERIVDENRTLDIRLNPGEALFFHDQRLLHGRKKFEAIRTGDRLLWSGEISLD